MKRFIDLFCGIGGYRIGLERQGLKCVFSSDINKIARQTYFVNFADLPFGDIRQIDASNIPEHDILCGGFPCQSFSVAGNRRGLKDENGRLFFEILRIAKHCNPKVILLENVKNIISMENGKIIDLLRKSLNRIGYKVYFNILNSSFYGIPQARERVYFVCLKKGLGMNYIPPAPTLEEVYVEDILDQVEDKNLYVERDDLVRNKVVEQNVMRPLRLGHVIKGRQGEKLYSVKGHAVTLIAIGGGIGGTTNMYKMKSGMRMLSLTECKQLMGFPKYFKLPKGASGYRLIGNSIVPRMVESVYRGICF